VAVRLAAELTQDGRPYTADPGSPLERAVRGEPVVHIVDARQAEAYRTSPVYKELVDLAAFAPGSSWLCAMTALSGAAL